MLRPYLELCRVFLTPTAVADSFAGYVLASSIDSREIEQLDILSVAAISMFLYWFGMATNDIFDLEKDRRAAPQRPLPSGRLHLSQAWAAANVLALGALVLSVPLRVSGPVLGILILALAYNTGGKNLPVLGNLLMGGCRAGNLLLGAAAALGWDRAGSEERVLLAASILGLYVAGVTAVSLREERKHRVRVFHSLTLPLLAVPLALALLNARSPFAWVNSGALTLLLVAAIRGATRGTSPAPPSAVFVRRALPGILLVDAGVLWSLTPESSFPLWQALTLYALLVLGWLWRRRWLQSGAPES